MRVTIAKNYLLMKDEVQIHFSTSGVIRILLVLVGFYLAYYFRNLILLIVTAIVIASAVEPAVARMEQYKIPRAIGTVLIYVSILLVVIGGVVLIVPVFIQETVNLANAVPGYLTGLEVWLNNALASAGFTANFESELPDPDTLVGVSNELQGVTNIFFSGAKGALQFVFGSLFNFLLVFILSFYFTVQKYGIDNFLKIVVPPSKIQYALNLWHRSQRKIGLWMRGQFILAAIIGVLTFFGLTFLGVKYAFLLAIIAMFGSLIPLIGPVVSVIPSAAIALADGGFSLVIKVFVLYFIIQQVESNFIYPMVVKNVVGVPALVVILGVIIGGSLFGFLGIVLSVPIAAAGMEYVRDIQKRNTEHEKRIEEAAKALEEDTLI